MLVPPGELLTVPVCAGCEERVGLAACVRCWGCEVVMHHECTNVVGPDIGMPWYCRHCEQAPSRKCNIMVDRPLLE